MANTAQARIELNAWLGDRCRALWDEVRHPEHDRFSVAEMLEHERPHLKPMPAPFDGYVEKPSRVSSTCWVVHQLTNAAVTEHGLAKLAQSKTGCHPARRYNQHEIAWIKLLRLLDEVLVDRHVTGAPVRAELVWRIPDDHVELHIVSK